MTIELMPPMGHFTLPQTDKAKHYVCFAAGSGITPVLSIIKTGLINQPQSELYFNLWQPHKAIHYF